MTGSLRVDVIEIQKVRYHRVGDATAPIAATSGLKKLLRQSDCGRLKNAVSKSTGEVRKSLVQLGRDQTEGVTPKTRPSKLHFARAAYGQRRDQTNEQKR